MASVETPLPGLGGEEEQFIEEYEVDAMDGSIDDMDMGAAAKGAPVSPEMQEAQGKFMQALTEIMGHLSEPCQEQFSQAMQGQTMESMTEECQLEFSKAASSVPDYAKMQEQYVKTQAEQALRKNGRQADPNTPYYLGVTLAVLFLAVVGYVMWVNRKLKEAGLLDRKPKALSKKKLEKERAKAQRKTK